MNNKKSILGVIIFLIWFLGSPLGMLVFSSINIYYSIMLFGQYFLVFGLLFFNAKNIIFENLLSIIIGLACIIIPFLMMNPEIICVEVRWEFIIVLLFDSIFILCGLRIIYTPLMKLIKKKTICNVEVSATIVDHNIISNDSFDSFCPIYEFEFNGEKYIVNNNEYTNFGFKPVGEIVTLNINPNNPNEFLDNDFSKYIFDIIMAIVCLGLSISILIMIIQNGTFIK